jgi:hypothetical protein
MHEVARTRARPETRRMVSTSDRQCGAAIPARTRAWIRTATTGKDRHEPSHALTMRQRRRSHERHTASARVVRHRPVSTIAPAADRRGPAQGAWVLRWLAWRSHPVGVNLRCQRTSPGHCLPFRLPARYGDAERAFLSPGPKRSRTLRQREHAQYDAGRKSVDETGVVIPPNHCKRWIRHRNVSAISRHLACTPIFNPTRKFEVSGWQSGRQRPARK